MAKKEVVHYQQLNNDQKSFCNRVFIAVADDASIYRHMVTCQHCRRKMKKAGIIQ